jgi:hypothetical protein
LFINIGKCLFNRFCPEVGRRGGGPNNVYTCVNAKNGKIKHKKE